MVTDPTLKRLTMNQGGSEIRSMTRQILIISTILFCLWFYVWERLLEPSALSEPLRWVALTLIAVFYCLQIGRFALRESSRDLTWVIVPGYFAFGLLIHLFFATLVKDLGYFVWWISSPDSFAAHEPALNGQILLLVFGLVVLANLWGTWNAYAGPRLQEITVDLREDPNSKQQLKLVQISDLHVGHVIKRRYVQNVVDKANAWEPDIVCMTGDVGDGPPETLTEDLAPLAQLKTKAGVYYCTGNHEYYWNVQGWIKALAHRGIRPLMNEGLQLPLPGRPVWIGGVTDISAGRMAGHHHSPQAAAQGAPPSAAKILLAHQPRSIFEATKAGFNLVLSGHTHGGQFFPFTKMVQFFNPYNQGLEKHDGKTWIYVNTGTGFWGPPLRLGVLSELTLMTVLV